MNTQLDIGQIRKFLPHRYPFLLLDRVLEVVSGKSLRAIKNVTVNEPFFQGHFPDHPVMPGVLLIEAMAQACAVLAAAELDEAAADHRIYYLAGIDKARFKRPIVPGDQLVIDAAIVRRIRGIWRCQANASVSGALAASCELMFTYKEVGSDR